METNSQRFGAYIGRNLTSDVMTISGPPLSFSNILVTTMRYPGVQGEIVLTLYSEMLNNFEFSIQDMKNILDINKILTGVGYYV